MTMKSPNDSQGFDPLAHKNEASVESSFCWFDVDVLWKNETPESGCSGVKEKHLEPLSDIDCQYG